MRSVVMTTRVIPELMHFSTGRKRSPKKPKGSENVSASSNKEKEIIKKFGKVPDKETLAELLRDINMNSEELSKTEAAKIQELDKILEMNPDLKNMSMEEIIGMLNITEEDKKSLTNQVNTIMSSGNLDEKNAEINKEFPKVEPEIERMMHNMELEFDKDPTLRKEFDSWVQKVQSSLGNEFEKMKDMTEDQLNSIVIPNEHLKSVMDRMIPDLDKMNSLNFTDNPDEGITIEPMKGENEKKEVDEDGEPIEVEEIKLR